MRAAITIAMPRCSRHRTSLLLIAMLIFADAITLLLTPPAWLRRMLLLMLLPFRYIMRHAARQMTPLTLRALSPDDAMPLLMPPFTPPMSPVVSTLSLLFFAIIAIIDAFFRL